ncbi:hypothetical protein SUGI_1006160 [Cryptomeria japonica]|nr:hypothetical protein SUGI_1006160 [Cryptomeria japonica]
MEMDSAVMNRIIHNFRWVDLRCGRTSHYGDCDILSGKEIGKFDKEWRDLISTSCRDVPFSTLRRAYQDRYCAITQGGEPLYSSTHHNNTENDPPLEWDTMEDDNNSNNPHLDFDAMEEILQRLPVPSLLRAKSISKAWNTAISATNFNANMGTDHFVTQQKYHGIAFFCASLNRWFPIPLSWSKDKWELCAASKGLFLFFRYNGTPVIFNALTRQHRFLPSLIWRIGRHAAELMVEAGRFEMISLTSIDKLLLYDSSTDELKDIPVSTDFQALRDESFTHSWKSTLHNGMAYFTNDFGCHLGCYDFARREFQFKEIEGGLPPKIGEFDCFQNSYPSLPSLVSCNGKLLLVGRLENETKDKVSIWGGMPFTKHTLVGIWALDSGGAENCNSWSLISVAPLDLLEDTVKSSHGTDFMVAASSDEIWLTIKGSMNVLTLNLRSMEWGVLPGYTAEDTVDTVPRRAFFVSFSNSPF